MTSKSKGERQERQLRAFMQAHDLLYHDVRDVHKGLCPKCGGNVTLRPELRMEFYSLWLRFQRLVRLIHHPLIWKCDDCGAVFSTCWWLFIPMGRFEAYEDR